MKKIQVNASVAEALRSLGDEAELCDASGQTVAVYLSSDRYQDLRGAWGNKLIPDNPMVVGWEEHQENEGKRTS